MRFEKEIYDLILEVAILPFLTVLIHVDLTPLGVRLALALTGLVRTDALGLHQPGSDHRLGILSNHIHSNGVKSDAKNYPLFMVQ